MSARPWRLAAGWLILLLLLAFFVLLIPVYYRNHQFEQALEELAVADAHQRSDDGLRAAVLERASRLGLPVQAGDVELERASSRLRIGVHYQVPVDLALYSVRLHFHPIAVAGPRP